MLKGYGRYGALASSDTPVYRGKSSGDKNLAVMASMERRKETATFNASGTSLANTNVSALGMNFELGAVEGILPESRRNIIAICRDIYKYDTVSGAAVDLMSNLPFSDFNLTGINDRKILSTYVKSIENLKMATLFPYLGRDFLTDGAFTATLDFDAARGIFNNITTHNNLNIEAKDVPVFGYDPILTLKIPKEIAEMMTGKSASDPRIKKLVQTLPEFLKQTNKKGDVLLDPINTLYIARKSFSFDSLGMSYLHRIIPLWLIEKALMRGSIEQSYQRQRAITHIIAGTDEWEPTDNELRQIVSLVVNANMDPTGAVIATRPDISFNEIIRGDDFYKHCMAGDSLIATEHGLLRIDEMEFLNNRSTQVLGGEGVALAAKWHSTGLKKVNKYVFSNGYEVRATKDHRFMVLKDGYNLEWVTGEELKIGDSICVQTKPNVTSEPLTLPVVEDRGSLKFPSTMNPKLAYATGVLNISGWLNGIMMQVIHKNKGLLDQFDQSINDIFNIKKLVPSRDKSTVDLIEKKPVVMFANRKVALFFIKLGLERRNSANSTEDYKSLPKMIRTADKDSQLAYVAACVDASGWITETSIEIVSPHQEHLKQLQILIAAHGHIGILEEDTLIYVDLDAYELYKKLSVYLKSEGSVLESEDYQTKTGIPTEDIYNFLETRKQVAEDGTVMFRCDDGELVETGEFGTVDSVDGFWTTTMFKSDALVAKMQLLKKISPDFHASVVKLFARNFYFADLTDKIPEGTEETFDLTMDGQFESSFVANGVVVHNSDVYDYLATAKLRALNISDSFLSGESTITTMEVALSVFMEQIKQFRSTVTREIFYDKIFPSIAFANKFKKSKRDLAVTSSENIYESNIREVNGRLIAVCDSSGLHDVRNIEDITEYYIPKVEWHKQLAPQADREYLDLLASMREQGIPVPIRMIAASAGLNIDSIMGMLDDDLKTRETLSDHLKDIAKLMGEEEGGGAFASFVESLHGVKKPKNRFKELAETQGFEVNERLKSGRRRPATGKYKKQLEELQDRKMANVLGRISRGEIATSKVARRLGKELMKKSAYGTM